MRIAVLPPFPDGVATAVENYFQLFSIRQMLGDHELVRVGAPIDKEFDFYLLMGDRFLEDGFWDKWILGSPKKVGVVACSVDPNRTWDARATEKIRAVAKTGGISALDEISYKKLKEILPTSSLTLGGSPGLFASFASLEKSEAVRVFCPGVSDPAFTGKHAAAFRRLSRRFYRRLGQGKRALFLVHSPSEFEFGSMPGSTTLFEPLHPQLHAKAIASAYSVYGFHTTALMLAVASGVPAVLLGNDRQSRSIAETAGVPFLEIHPNTDPTELEHRAEEIVRKYPWETIRDKGGRLKENLLGHLKELGLKPRETKRRTAKLSAVGSNAALPVATILGREELGAFGGFYENLAEISTQEVHHHVLTLDRETEIALQKTFAGKHVYLYRPSEIWKDKDITPLLLPMVKRRFLLKPRFLSVLLTKSKAAVVYADASTWFYRCPTELVGALENGNSLFFPRWSDRVEKSLSTSSFDTSLMVVAPGAEPTLDWWSVTAGCAVEDVPQSASMSEPGFLSMAPVLFSGTRVYRNADQNVAREGSGSLGLHAGEWEGDPARLADERNIKSLHWDLHDASGYLAIKGVWDQVCHLFSDLPSLSRGNSLREAVLLQQARHWPDLGRCLKAVGLRNHHLPWFASPPTDRWLRFFVSGSGRWLGRLVGRISHIGTPRAKSKNVFPDRLPYDSNWVMENRKRIFAPFLPEDSGAASRQVVDTAASA